MPGSTASEDDSPAIVEIDMIQNHGIGASDIAKLKGAKLFTIGLVAMCSRRKLLEIKGFSEIKVEKIKEAVAKCQPGTGGFVTAHELREKRKCIFHVSTGCKSFDAMLGGGFSSSSLNQVYGEYRCGKTQLAHTLCVTAQLPKEMGGAEGKVAFIDTEGTFRPQRIIQIAERYGLDPEAALENISYARCANTETLQSLIDNLAELFVSGEYKLLIIDSVIALYRVDFSGRGELAERQQALSKMLHQCNKLVNEFNICVFMTNQVMSDPGASALFASGPKAAGGHIMSHSSTSVVALRKGRGEERVAKMIDSPDLPEGDCTYVISTGGITDADKS